MKKLIILSGLVLTACSEMPPKSICDDYRMVTYYDNAGLPVTKGGWELKTTTICVVKEQRIERPQFNER